MKDSFFDLLYATDLHNKTCLGITFLRHISIKKDKFNIFLNENPDEKSSFHDTIENFQQFERNNSNYIIEGNEFVIDNLIHYLDDDVKIYQLYRIWQDWERNRKERLKKMKNEEFKKLASGEYFMLAIINELENINKECGIIISENIDPVFYRDKIYTIKDHTNNALGIANKYKKIKTSSPQPLN